MTVLHLSHARHWRGGENQIRLLVEYLPAEWRGRLGVPHPSELRRRLSEILPIDVVRNGGPTDIASILGVRRLVRRHRVTLVHAHDSASHMTAAMALLGLDVPLVVSRRNAFAAKGGWKYRRADHFITVSRAGEDRLRAAGVANEKISVIFDAVDFAALDGAMPNRLGVPESACLVLCAAAFEAEKDHHTLLQAWSIVERRNDTAILHLAGSGSLEDACRAQARALGLLRVRFLGWREDLGQLIQGADIVALSSRMEGLGSVLCEAQGAGKPVVATSAGGIVDAVSDGRTGLLSRPGDAAGLADNLLQLIHEPDFRLRLGLVAQPYARKRFSPETIAGQHVEIYQKIAEKAG